MPFAGLPTQLSNEPPHSDQLAQAPTHPPTQATDVGRVHEASNRIGSQREQHGPGNVQDLGIQPSLKGGRRRAETALAAGCRMGIAGSFIPAVMDTHNCFQQLALM